MRGRGGRCGIYTSGSRGQKALLLHMHTRVGAYRLCAWADATVAWTNEVKRAALAIEGTT